MGARARRKGPARAPLSAAPKRRRTPHRNPTYPVGISPYRNSISLVGICWSRPAPLLRPDVGLHQVEQIVAAVVERLHAQAFVQAVDAAAVRVAEDAGDTVDRHLDLAE